MPCDSEHSSVELEDAVVECACIDESSARLSAALTTEPATFYERWLAFSSEKALITRIEKYEKDELKTFIAQKLFKVDRIVCDEQTRLILIEKLLLSPPILTNSELDQELRVKYGSDLVSWLLDRLLPAVADCGKIIDNATHEYSRLRMMDPLRSWQRGSAEQAGRVLRSVRAAAASISRKVGWSLLQEPGTLCCHLNNFLREYSRLDAFFSNNPLSPAESATTAFDANHLTKARNKMITCCDESRLRLHPLLDSTGHLAESDDHFRRTRLLLQLFDDDTHLPEVADASGNYGTTDFIHASYIQGGPLNNTFICAQAPLPNTQIDFWRMVWQERSELIVMLCEAVDEETLAPMKKRLPNFCPFYWPRCEGESIRFGVLTVKNIRVDGTADPLFNVTHLEITRNDSTAYEPLLVQHWQWDWRHFHDVHWPLRVLRRARLSPSPTIVQCLDGCARSGTLVSLEVALMQLLRGSPLPADVVFVSALFTRLQRRHSISSALQYLWIYRVVIHWIGPFISSFSERVALGICWLAPKTGFIPLFDKYARDNTKLAAFD